MNQADSGDVNTAVRLLSPLLYTPRRIRGQTCAVCTTPTAGGAQYCDTCFGQRQEWGTALADLIVPLTYASDTETQQIRYNLAEYKRAKSEQARKRARVSLSWMTWWFANRHWQCLERAAGVPIDFLVTVPSGSTDKPSDHPVHGFLGYLSPPTLAVRRIQSARSRAIEPQTLALDGDVRDRAVVVLDDTWVSGASAQAVSVALKQAGARWVGVIALGRWANDSWGPTHEFFTQHRRPTWDARFCPVESRFCPWP